jgi:transcription initiation factor TFIIIB Brf1 subunit/transcription initiation factor TFIIB
MGCQKPIQNISGHRNLMQAFSELDRLKDKPSLSDAIVQKDNVKGKDLSPSYRVLTRELEIKVSLADPMKCTTKIANKANLRRPDEW